MTTFDPAATPEQRLKAVRDFAQTLANDTAPILIGPWRSELGFEASYFLAFIAWLTKHIPTFAQRAAVVTRGGLAPLYAGIQRAVDLYSLRSVTDVRRENLKQQRRTGMLKQAQVTEWDREVLKEAARRLGISGYHTVHPAWMYWGLSPYWDEQQGMRYLLKMTDYAPIPKPAFKADLPPRFVAVKFYARPTWPYPDPSVAEFCKRVTATLATQIPVVMLESADAYDDHADIPIVGQNIIAVGRDVPADQNLLVQAAVLSRAVGFVGTYGGVAQLAVRMGVPSVSLYHTFGGTSHAHYALQSWISKTQNIPFAMGTMQEASLWNQCLSVPMLMESVKPAVQQPVQQPVPVTAEQLSESAVLT